VRQALSHFQTACQVTIGERARLASPPKESVAPLDVTSPTSRLPKSADTSLFREGPLDRLTPKASVPGWSSLRVVPPLRVPGYQRGHGTGDGRNRFASPGSVVESLVVRILWLFGPPGVGKSVTSWELLNLLSDRHEATSYVDIDQLGMADPEPGDEGEAHVRKAWALAAVSRVHAQRGATTLVVSGVLDPDQMEFYRRALADFDLALVRLAVDEVVLRRRMDSRGHYAEDWFGVLAHARRHEAAGHTLPVVRTDGGTPSEVARRVLDAARTLPIASSARADESTPATATEVARAMLITGSRVIGKSTVGWLAFMMARQSKIPTAFVDLRQLGFHGRAGGPTDHALQAATTGALWRVFRARGNQLLLLNGTTDDPAQANLYADHLNGTPMNTIRLTAARSELTARARARSRGEMAPLAGDDIVGADEVYLQSIVHDALLAQESWSLTNQLVLDTTSLSATDSARMVLDLATT